MATGFLAAVVPSCTLSNTAVAAATGSKLLWALLACRDGAAQPAHQFEMHNKGCLHLSYVQSVGRLRQRPWPPQGQPFHVGSVLGFGPSNARLVGTQPIRGCLLHSAIAGRAVGPGSVEPDREPLGRPHCCLHASTLL